MAVSVVTDFTGVDNTTLNGKVAKKLLLNDADEEFKFPDTVCKFIASDRDLRYGCRHLQKNQN